MKALTLFCVVGLLFGLVAAVQNVAIPKKDGLQLPQVEVTCNLCIDFMNQALNQLLSIIEQIGIGGGCSEVCGALPNQYLAVVCDLVCEYVGMEEFSNLLEAADPDPVWICMATTICPSKPDAAAKITSMQVTPQVGKVNQPLDFSMTFQVVNQTGMTDVALVILSPKNDGFPIQGDWEAYSQPPGTYGQKVRFTPKPNQYDPFPAGTYTAIWYVCEGPCGCTHQICHTMDKQKTTFQLTR